MSDALNRLNTAVVRIVTDVATDLRNHPAAQSDDGALNDAAAKLEAAATDLENANKPADTGGQATS